MAKFITAYSGSDAECYEEACDLFEAFVSDLARALKALVSEDSLGYLLVSSNSNWRGATGYRVVDAHALDDVDLVRAIMPDCDYSAEAHGHEDVVSLSVSHHDCPMGSGIEVFALYPALVEEVTDSKLMEAAEELVEEHREEYDEPLMVDGEINAFYWNALCGAVEELAGDLLYAAEYMQSNDVTDQRVREFEEALQKGVAKASEPA